MPYLSQFLSIQHNEHSNFDLMYWQLAQFFLLAVQIYIPSSSAEINPAYIIITNFPIEMLRCRTHTRVGVKHPNLNTYRGAKYWPILGNRWSSTLYSAPEMLWFDESDSTYIHGQCKFVYLPACARNNQRSTDACIQLGITTRTSRLWWLRMPPHPTHASSAAQCSIPLIVSPAAAAAAAARLMNGDGLLRSLRRVLTDSVN